MQIFPTKTSVKMFSSILFLLVVTTVFAQWNPHWGKSRSAIVHLFEWPFTDIATECEKFLSVKGYAGVQTSPVSENLIVSSENRPWWERYQVMSYKIASRSGDEKAFKDMTKRCNAVGVRIYVDVVLNHMTGEWKEAKGTAGSRANTTQKYYPAVPYKNEDFHPSCGIDNYKNATNVRNCELYGLKDLNQSSSYVREKIVDFLNHLIDLGVAGFRIDSAKHMWPSDLKVIYGRLKNLNTDYGFPKDAKPFIYQQIIDLDNDEAVKNTEYTGLGAVTEFKFSEKIGPVFRGHVNLTHLKNWGEGWGFLPSNVSLVFVDNHDNQRGHGDGGESILTHKTSKQYKMAQAFTLAYPYGIPRIMSSFAFKNTEAGPPQDKYGNIIGPVANSSGSCKNGWICEHRWRQISNMIGFRNVVKGKPLKNWWSNGKQQIAFCRGNAGFVAFTNGGNINRRFQTCLPKGTYCDVISGGISKGSCTGKTVTVNDKGYGKISLSESDKDGVLAIHIKAKKK